MKRLDILEVHNFIDLDSLYRFYLSRDFYFSNDQSISNPKSQLSKNAIELQRELGVVFEQINRNFPG